ncbi:MAG: MOSC domain-containing protein [Bdellovibrionota bacterium]
MALAIEALTLYPVKSCGAVPVNRLHFTSAGPQWDREWMIVTGDGKFITQREMPRLALVHPHLDFAGGFLRLASPGVRGGVEISLSPSGSELEVEIWDSPAPAIDEGVPAASWLSQFLGVPARLVRITPANRVQSGSDPRTMRFTDSYPVHVCTTESLADLNRRLPAPIGMQRFRPNLVVSGGQPWMEDHWKAIRIHGHEFRVGKRAECCTITTVDPLTALRGPEPLKTLAGFRRNAKNKIEFGQYLHTAPGAEIAVGMEVEPVLG